MSGPPLAESRVEGRVLLIDAQERLLLLRVEDPAIDQPSLWITPGGGCEQGESPREAALRELYEEIGYRACELGPCVWRRKFRWRWGKRLIDSDSHYFLLRLNSVIEVSHAHASRLE
ncbi:NUDIX domain-containing protein [Botrimarina hoheduenensis]|uniref:Diadenosine hexaphosphate hydrolase n=1 Tax=Botrimarina hoheduenensis TaxID=2528000 RepID=A0A5C5VXA4_9BACT|nr:NUDIX domain-containing protein [Botrimarina hoheduenensis]TWT42767.1 Diadenosine hexaphosphate hydrolase [Botrimarina hoheduenensis]